MCERWKDQRRDEWTLDDYDDLAETFQRARREIARARTCRCWYNNRALISHYATLLKWASVPWLFSGLKTRYLSQTLNSGQTAGRMRTQGYDFLKSPDSVEKRNPVAW